MQDRYAGDVGDFGKFGFLRHLKGEKQLGVVWYRYPNEPGNQDGRFTEYLQDPRYPPCDRVLHVALGEIVNNNRRTVAAIEASGVLDEGTSFFSDVLDYSDFTSPACTTAGKEERLVHRENWMERAVDAMMGCDIIFLDPDNGLEVPSAVKHAKKGPKHVFRDELNEFTSIEGVDSVVLYHHLNRHKNYGSHVKQMADRKREIIESVGANVQVAVLRFFPRSPRAFFVICTTEDEFIRVQDSINIFRQPPWNQFFTHH